MKENWIEEISKNIDEKIDLYISVKDYRFYQIEKLKRIAKLLYQQTNCLDCKHSRDELEAIVNDLDRLINKSGVNRREYEKRIESLINHLKEKHEIYQAHHFTYTYSAIFTLVGACFGFLLSFGIFYSFHPTSFFLAAGLGMFAGNVLGSRKDKFCMKNGKQI